MNEKIIDNFTFPFIKRFNVIPAFLHQLPDKRTSLQTVFLKIKLPKKSFLVIFNNPL